ncbi:MAG TPA: DinB family protein [Roseiflexaceae bacterium]|nr:DinB family protein [Roseiflexaceae bacterium]
MNVKWCVAQLGHSAQAIGSLVAGVDAERARWRPAPGSWSMVEVLNHLLDEEREDFRTRIDLTLHHPEREWPPIDPQAWVVERDYQSRDLAESIARFEAERQHSLSWLRGLTADWNVARRHPAGFELRAGDLLASWVAHDLLHLRQLVELHYHSLSLGVGSYHVGYAGDW